jgi:bifunctional dethiobiotin synthetase / adenosylmethionine---8-amino-7-oxononanoate aminotransferase
VHGAFAGDDRLAALLHGHSYTANPVACHVAATALAAYPHAPQYDAAAGRMRTPWPADALQTLSEHPAVRQLWALGSVMAVELATPDGGLGGYASHAARGVVAALRQRGVFARPLGPTVYLMVTPFSPVTEAAWLLRTLAACLAAQPASVASTPGPVV